MKKLTIVVLALLLVAGAGATVFAATRSGGEKEFSGAFAYGTGPADFDNGFGLSFGAGYMMNNINNLQARLDISYFLFDRDVANTNVDLTRIPVAVGGRYFFSTMDKLNLFGEAAVEASFDDAEFVDVLGVKHSESEVNWGVTPGAGAEYFIQDTMSLFALGRFHIVSDDYFSLHFGAAYHF